MNWAFGSARQLYNEHVHPRLLAGPDDLPELRRLVRTGKGRVLMRAVRARVADLTAAVADIADLTAALAHHTVRTDPRGGSVLEGAAEIGLVSVLDGDPAAIETARRILAAIPEAERRGPRDTYSAGYASWGNLQLLYDFCFPLLSTAESEAFAAWAADVSVRQSLAKLRDGHYLRHTGANIPMVGLISALFSLLAIDGDPGTPDLAAEKAELLDYFQATLFGMMGENGYPHEDIGYGSGMVSLLARLVDVTRRAGLYDAYAQCPRYRRFGQAMLHFVQPWGRFLSNTGDYGADFGWRSPVFPRLAAENEDPTLLWLHGTLSYPIACSGPVDMRQRLLDFPEIEVAPGLRVPVDAYSVLTLGDLRRAVHPARRPPPTQYMDPDRGIVTFRSSWAPDATFVVFDGAHRSSSAQGHSHDSGGHFSLSALGEYFAVDTGRYNIEQDQHNVVLVDGRSGRSTDGQWRMTWYHAALTDYAPAAFVDTARVDNSQMSNCYWSQRWLGLVKDPAGDSAPAYVWTVDDVNFANDYREFWWTLNANPDHRIRIDGKRATITGSDHGNCLDCFFVLPAPEVYPKPHRLRLTQNLQLAGSEKYLSDRRKLARDYRRLVGNPAYGPSYARPRLVARVKGYNGRFLTLMVPRRKGEPVPVVERLEVVDNSLAAKLVFGEVEDTVIFAYDHCLLRANGVDARGQWCVVRRRRRDGRVTAWELGHGDSLTVAGQRLR